MNKNTRDLTKRIVGKEDIPHMTKYKENVAIFQIRVKVYLISRQK
jgi:hypothetical protein